MGMGGMAMMDAAFKIGDMWMASTAQHNANRLNIRLQRDQQRWEENMSNTAVQRRKNDILMAGGNPALAFTNGQEASTPTIAPARVEPTYRGGNDLNLTAKMIAQAQVKNIEAQTIDTLASARSKKVQADLDESLIDLKKGWQANKYTEETEQQDLKTKIMRSLDISSAAEAKRTEGVVDKMIQMAAQQAERGKIDLEALRNIAAVGGIEAKAATPIIKLILDMFRLGVTGK